MSIAAAVEQAIAPRYCKFGGILRDLPDVDHSAIVDGIKDGLTYKDAARILTDNGFPIGADSVRVHAKGDCCCKDAA